MKTAIILHGMPEKEEWIQNPSQSNKHWLAWLQGQLTLHGVVAQTPELPVPYEPSYEKWKEVFEHFEVNEETALVGHSCGGGFLVRWLTENTVKVGKVALIAPWLDPLGELKTGFFDFTVDPALPSRTEAMKIFVSTDDGEEVLTSVERLRRELASVEVEEFSDRGHFTLDDMKTERFPELLEFLMK